MSSSNRGEFENKELSFYGLNNIENIDDLV